MVLGILALGILALGKMALGKLSWHQEILKITELWGQVKGFKSWQFHPLKKKYISDSVVYSFLLPFILSSTRIIDDIFLVSCVTNYM